MKNLDQKQKAITEIYAGTTVSLAVECCYCGSKFGYLGASGVHCAENICSTPLDTIRIGLIAGRHPMPVYAYPLPENATEESGYHQGMYDAAFKAAYNAAKNIGDFELFISGLTTAALGAVAGMKAAGIKEPLCQNFDKETGEYMAVVCR